MQRRPSRYKYLCHAYTQTESTLHSYHHWQTIVRPGPVVAHLETVPRKYRHLAKS